MSDASPTKRPWSIWKILLLSAGIFTVCCLVWFYNLVSRRIPESYAAWTTGNLIVDYLATHENQWPRSWEDLDKATNCQRYTRIEILRTKVKIDWEVNFEHLLQVTRTNRATPLRLVTRLNGKKLRADWGPDTEPNYKIKGYLLWVLAQTNSPVAVITNLLPKLEDSLQ